MAFYQDLTEKNNDFIRGCLVEKSVDEIAKNFTISDTQPLRDWADNWIVKYFKTYKKHPDHKNVYSELYIHLVNNLKNEQIEAAMR